MKMKMKMKTKGFMTLMAAALAAASAQAATNVYFTGASGTDLLFSNTNNWNAYPVSGDHVNISANNTSVGNPAIIDPGFNVQIANFLAYSVTDMGTGMAYAEVVSNAVAKMTILRIGNPANQWFDGTLVLREGGRIENPFIQSGFVSIGGASAGMEGYMVVEPAASLRHTQLTLDTYGELTFQFGVATVTTLQTTKSNMAATNLLNGLLRLDLADLSAAGSYTIIDSGSTNLVIGGALRDWLDATGGVFGGTGPFSTNHFEVVNAADGFPWELRLADGGQDLVFVALANHFFIKPLVVGASQDTTLRGAVSNNRADLGRAKELFVALDGNLRGILEFDLSGADGPITNAALTLVQTMDLAGTWGFGVYPMAYTTNNYDWYEGTGTWIHAVNTDAPAATNGAACFLYRRDDPVLPAEWEDASGNPLANAVNPALWGAAIGTASGTDSVVGRRIDFALDAPVLEEMRTNGVGRIVLGVWGSTALSGNHFFASKENANVRWRPSLELQMEIDVPPPPAPEITGINVAGNAVSVAFDASAGASLWFKPELIYSAWSNVVSGSSPLSHTNSAPAGFYKVTIP